MKHRATIFPTLTSFGAWVSCEPPPREPPDLSAEQILFTQSASINREFTQLIWVIESDGCGLQHLFHLPQEAHHFGVTQSFGRKYIGIHMIKYSTIILRIVEAVLDQFPVDACTKVFS